MHLRPSLLIVIFAVLDLVTGNDPCPLAQCQCYQSTDDTTKRVIDCRDINSGGDITNIVNVATPTNEVFYELALQRSRITSVGPNVFQGLKFVKLDLTENFITSFDIDAFSGLQNDLRIVRLEASGSVSFPFQAMQNLTGLQEIYLKNFQQQGLDSNTKFEYFPNLQKLSMISSNIQFISSSAFNGKLTNLRELEFTHNPSVSSFPVPAIRNLRTLTKLTWTFNDMDQTSPQMFSQLTNLVELDLSHNKINSLADNWYTGITSKIEFLNLQANNLSTATIQSMGIPDWPKLHQLNLAVNNLQDFPSGFFSKMPDLAYLGLGSNKLTTLRSTYFTGLANMYSLDFHENFIASVESGALAHMPLLRSVNLENQNVATLNFSAGSISGAEGIEQLYLINTPVIQNEMWGAIRKMTNLTELHLTRTKITSIPDLVFQNHQRLVLLDIEGNSLGIVTQAMFHGLASSLESISLTNTGIQTIGECVFKDFNKLKTIHLGQNSLTCDCKLHWLYDWIQNSNEPFIESIVLAVCSTPASLKDQNIANVNRNQLVCDSGYVPEPCQVFTTTTTVSTTSTAMSSTTTPIPLPSVSFAVSTTGTAYIAVSWAVTGDTTYLLSFDVTYQKLGELNPTTQKFPVDKSKRDYRLDGLVHDTTYLVCLEALIQSSRPITSCVTQSTMKDTGVTMGPQTGDSNEVGIIVGVVVGGVVAIVIIVLVLIILLNRGPMKKTPPPAQPVHFTRTPQDAPRVGYDSKRFSKPKKESANGHVNITVISDGKHNSRISAGSYQEVRNDSKVNNNLYPNTVNLSEGAHGSTPDWKMQNTKVPFSQNPHHMQPSAQSRYVNNPTKMNRAPAAPSYVNTDRQNAYNDHYANSMEARPLPKTPNNKPLSDKSSGFLNHGFTHSPTDSSSFGYTNEPQSGHDSVYNELDYDSGTVV